MKNNLIKKLAGAAALGLVLLGTSCKKLSDFGDTNLNPAATTSPITKALLTNVMSQLGGLATNNRAGIYAQYFSEAEYPTISLYAIPQVDYAGTYSGPLNDLQNVINVKTSPAEVAVARILKAYIFWTLTDRYGDIPYFQALKGTVPTFDKQEDIYKDLLKELTEAKAQIATGGVILGDITYGGDIVKWQKLANSLRMLIALNMSKRYPGPNDFAAMEFKAALADGPSISTNADNWQLAYPGGAFRNPWFVTNADLRDLGEALPLVNLLGSLGDTRQSAFGSSNVGVPYGYTEGQINVWRQSNTNWSRIIHPNFRQATSPIIMINAAEILLARAEAADRGWTSEDMVTLYNTGITTSFEQWGLTIPSNYLTQSSVMLTAPAGTGANIPKIAVQEYLASFPDGLRGWSIVRRTGYPVLADSPNPLSTAHTTMPRRFTYGIAEYANNPGGVAVAIANQGPDVQETRMWWDK